MLVGDKSECAVDIKIENNFDGWVFGTYLLWVRGIPIGDDYDNSVDLKGCWNWMRDFVTYPENRYEPDLYDMDKRQVYLRLATSVLPNENPSGFAKEVYEDTTSRFHIDHIGMSSFNRYILLLVKDEKGMERLVWRESYGDIQDVYLSAGQLESVFAEAVRLLEDTMVSAGDKV
ncbi:Imm42 family immunity protein [Dyella silvatica]|uniref:Imm42 family immunity protein n=1 Tax=Dyella silvatica TaxID=2992128 RepID=UPI00225A5D78|nr:Imm42 family immunity protein [Dyella silvatica]